MTANTAGFSQNTAAEPTFFAAPDLAKAGYRVFPVRGKKPTVEGGLYAATTDLSQIAAWIEGGHGDDDIAVATGIPSGIVAIDADSPKTYAEMEAKYGPPAFKNSRGGHWLFRHPRDGKVLSNSIRKDLDRKADGGYIVVPPSRDREWTMGSIPLPGHLPVLPPELRGEKKNPLADEGECVLDEDVRKKAAETIAAHVRNIENGKRHEHLRHLCGVLLRRKVSTSDTAHILIDAWDEVGGDLAERAPEEVPNTLRTTAVALEEGHATGVPSMEKITPGLFGELGELFGWESTNSQVSIDAIDTIDGISKEILPDAPPFPVDAMPRGTRTLIKEAAAAIGCAPDLVAQPMLVVLGSAIGNSRVIELKKGWQESAAIYGAVIAARGEKKTPALKVAIAPATVAQAELRKEYREKRKQYEEELREWEVQKKDAAKDGYAAPAPPEEPDMLSTLVEDTTVEALARVLEVTPRGVVAFRDELSGWVRSMDQYKQGGRGADRQFWLSTYSNTYARVDRKTKKEPLIIERPFVGVFGGIQPTVLPELGSGREDGMLDRFLFAYPEPVPSEWTDDDISEEARESYARLYRKLRDLYMPMNKYDSPDPVRVFFSPPAKDLLKRAVNELRREMYAPGFPTRLKGPWSKLEGYLGRLCLILALCRAVDQGAAEIVEEDDVLCAVGLVDYFKQMARRVYVGLYGEDTDDGLAEDVVKFLKDRGGSWEGQPHELHAELESGFKPPTPEALTRKLKVLAQKHPGALHFDSGPRWVRELGNNRRFVTLSLENGVNGVNGVNGGEA
jgi:hypothetical protein